MNDEEKDAMSVFDDIAMNEAETGKEVIPANKKVDTKKQSNKKEEKVKKEIPWICLGYNKDFNFVWSKTKQCIFQMKTEEFKESGLINIFGSDFFDDNDDYIKLNYGKNGSVSEAIDTKKVRNLIVEGCIKKGVFEIDNVKGAGIWHDAELDNLVVNGKDIFAINSKEIVQRITEKSIYLVCKDIGLKADTPQATKEDRELLFNIFKTFKYKNNHSMLFDFGGTCSLYLTGALPNRPPYYTTGQRGSGKSWRQRLNKNLFNNLAIYMEGYATTEPGLRQKVGNNSIPVLIDEFEADGIHGKAIIEMCRSSYSGGHVYKGTSDQKGTVFTVRFSPYITGIMPQQMDSADISRFIFIELNPLNKAAMSDDEKAEHDKYRKIMNDEKLINDLGMKMFSFMVNNWKDFFEVYKIVRMSLSDSYSERFSDTYTNSVAASYMVQFFGDDNWKNEEKIEKYIKENFPLENLYNVSNISDETECMNILMNKVVSFEKYMAKDSLINITSEIYANKDTPKIRSDKNRMIGNHGVMISYDRAEDKCYLVVNTREYNLKTIFKGTKFEKADLKFLLSRISGSMEVNTTIACNKCRALRLPIDENVFSYKDSEVVIETPKTPDEYAKEITDGVNLSIEHWNESPDEKLKK